MKKSQFVILLVVIVLCAGGIFGYVKYRLDKQEVDNNKAEEKQEESKTSDSNEKEKDSGKLLCESSLKYDNKVYSYSFKANDEDLVLKVFYDNKQIFEAKQNGYFLINSLENSYDYCANNKIIIESVSNADDYKYSAVEWKNIDDDFINYSIISEKNNVYSTVVDLTMYSRTGFADSVTGKNIEPYRIIDSSLYVIELSDARKGKEMRYSFKNGTYNKEYTGKIFEGASGNL